MQESAVISTRNLIVLIVLMCAIFGAVAFLDRVQQEDTDAFRISRTGGKVTIIENDPNAVRAAQEAMMPLRLSDEGTITYVEAVDTCNWAYVGECINVRSGPGVEYPSVMKLRKGVVLRVDKVVRNNYREWYKITFDEYVRYPERLGTELYVARDAVQSFELDAPHDLKKSDERDENKRIIVDLSDQALYAYDGDKLFMMSDVSTGLDGIPTPLGAYEIFRKMPSRYMQGPIPGQTSDEYDLPGVPWTMYFTGDGAAIHGAYWHDEFGFQHSHGCVNLPLDLARKLYEWAPLGTLVIVQE